jgi:hypothetical protein
MSRPVCAAGCNGPPCSGTTSEFRGIVVGAGADGATPTVGAEGTVSRDCWAKPADGSMVAATAAIMAILRMGTSCGYNHRMEMVPQKFNLKRLFLPPDHADGRANL